MVWCGTVRYGVVRYGTVCCGAVPSGMVWCGAVRYGAVRYDVHWCGTLQRGAVWYGMVWCGAVRYGTMRCSTVRYVTRRVRYNIAHFRQCKKQRVKLKVYHTIQNNKTQYIHYLGSPYTSAVYVIIVHCVSYHYLCNSVQNPL